MKAHRPEIQLIRKNSLRQQRAIYDEFLTVTRQAFWMGLRWGMDFYGYLPVSENLLSGLGTAAPISLASAGASGRSRHGRQLVSVHTGPDYLLVPVDQHSLFWSSFQQGWPLVSVYLRCPGC